VKRRVRDLQRRDVRVLRYQPYAAASAGPPAFLPSSLSGLQLWLDGADEATKTLNGSNVSAWLDKSGNNRNATQGAAATQPLNVSGGAPVAGVDFVDGTNVLALASALSFGTAATIVVVVTANAAANAYVYADAGSADGIISGFAVGGDLEWFNSSGGTDRQKYIDNPVAGSRYRSRSLRFSSSAPRALGPYPDSPARFTSSSFTTACLPRTRLRSSRLTWRGGHESLPRA
jgi:hypothetical protein